MIGQANVKALPLANESVGMIFADPPYTGDMLVCYKWLVREAVRTLRPGGFVLAMAGEYWLPSIVAMFESEPRLVYFWRFTCLNLNGDAPYIRNRGVVAQTKSILAYAKGPGPHRGQVNSILSCYHGRKDKRFHHWGTDVDIARYYIDCFSYPEDLICDPFLGGGTTAVACELLRRRWVGFDIDSDALWVSSVRLSDERTAAVYGLPLFCV